MNRIILYIKALLRFLFAVVQNRRILFTLTKEDLRQRYVGSYLGILWAFIQPAITILVLWFIFDIGFKSQPVENHPFILWLMAGMIPWFFFADSIQSGTTSILSKPYMVQKIVFKVSLLPIVQIFSAGVIHLFFIVVLIGFNLAYGFPLTIYWLQIPYYSLAASVLLLGLTWITSSIVIFFRDLGQVISVIIQIGFWATPIFWTLTMIPQKYHVYFKLNPVFYITEGYRNALIKNVWFWEHWHWSIYYWTFTVIIFFFGALIFSKLRPHFADVL